SRPPSPPCGMQLPLLPSTMLLAGLLAASIPIKMLEREPGHDVSNTYRLARNQSPAPRARYPAVVETSLRGAARSFFPREIPAAASELPSGEPRNVAGRLRDFAMVSDGVHQHRKRNNAGRAGSARAGVEAGGRGGTNQR